jgi:hypothetical protein
MVAGRYRSAFLIGLLLLLCAGCSFTAPPDSAGPAVVLDAYLRALKSGDCAAGKVLGTATFSHGNGELCGATSVVAYRVVGDPATPTNDEAVFGTTLTTTGTGDGSVPAGDVTWFYSLERQANGAWRLAGGGSGP